ncbi:MAG: hypothetical protein HKN92_10110 [Chitinophagales bacterium]|nr:hypothetical protein [Chitinophagales bacterium]
MKIVKITMYSLALFILAGCGGNGGEEGSAEINSKRAGINEVITWESANPDKINPLISNSANSGYIERYIYQSLLEIHPTNFEYLPTLAAKRPLIEDYDGFEEGGQKITYDIRPEAKWDNGSDVTGHDAAFSLKVLKNTNVDCQNVRPYMEFVEDIILYEDDPKKFTLVCRDKYFMSEIWSSLTMYPEHIFDPNKVMRNYTVPWLNDPANADKMKSDEDLIAVAESMNSDEYGRDPEFVQGSGPYKLQEFKTNQRVILVKKENWWGDQFTDEIETMQNYPDKLIFEIITEPTTALTALKDEQLDVMRGVKHKDFSIDLLENKSFTSLYELYKPMALQYSYIGLNMKRPELSDKRVRAALAHLMDIDYILEVLLYDLAVPIAGPIHPSKPYLNKDLEPRKYDPELAKKLMDEAGWTDSDGDGVRNKMIDGQKTDLSLVVKYPQGSETGEKILLMFQENARKAGVKIDMISREWTVFLEENKKHDFDMYSGGWVAAPTLSDLKQIWHTESYNRGGNYVGFGNARSDELIELIRYEPDEAKRNEYYQEIQEIIYDEVPYIFMFSSLSRIAIHKRFEAEAHVKRPGYYEGSFVLQPNFGVRAVATK